MHARTREEKSVKNGKKEVEFMSKDGTLRGGTRPRSGQKRKSVTEKVNDPNRVMRKKVEVLNFQTAALEGEDMPPPSEYLSAKQQNGQESLAADIYGKTVKWLEARNCAAYILPAQIEQYAMAAARWIQCESYVDRFGLLAKHPTTGNAIQSPYVAMSQTFSRQANSYWQQILQTIKENCSTEFKNAATPQDDVMERLLRSRGG
jgi:hypothetical protein